MTTTLPLTLTRDQRFTLQVILDTFLAPLSAPDTTELHRRMTKYPAIPTSHVDLMARTSATTLSNTHDNDDNSNNLAYDPVDTLLGFLQRSLPGQDADSKQQQQSFLQLIHWLGTTPGMWVLSQGRHGKALTELSLKERTRLFHGWRHSRFAMWRQLYRTLAALTWAVTYLRPEAATTLHQAMGYPTWDPVRSLPTYVPVHERPRLPLTDQPHPNGYDVIVIGSSAGGGVVAAQAAMAGLSVLVIEKGPYYHESEYVLHEGQGNQRNLERQSTFMNEEGTMGFMAGSLVGGGTSINYLASLKLPHYVRKEWADLGLPYFTSNKFSQDIDRVCERIGATTDGIRLYGSNQILMDGCKNLGYHHELIPQNTGGHPHECHWCCVGCRDGIKNGSMNTWLRDAVAHGAHLMASTTVHHVTLDPTTHQATGVVILNNGGSSGSSSSSSDGNNKSSSSSSSSSSTWIQAKRVVVSAGTLHSPGILQRSGLSSKHLGSHLRIHPCVATYGYFDHVIDTHKGTMMTAYSDIVTNFKGDHYGAKIEGVSHHAGMMANATPWHGSLDHKYALLRWRYATPLLTVSRDKNSVGHVVYQDNGQLVKVHYTMSKRDQQSVLEGMVASAHIFVAAGAREIRTMQPTVDPFVFEDHETPAVDHPRYQRWIKAVRDAGAPAVATTPHQMGTCRMGKSPHDSVVKPTGETWQAKGLYVADASVFPTGSGVRDKYKLKQRTKTMCSTFFSPLSDR